ncbi:MAG TPA: tetratricopeptide repeat protein [Bryobacteraceae bacterium]|nr:tetratricopeptide repeat protein [Bryobacteraceae bacterium]
MRWVALIGVSLGCITVLAASDWTVARSPHSEIYSQAGEENARSMALLSERLYSFFSPLIGPEPGNRPPLRVVVFRSPADYAPYRLRPSADAYYMGNELADYIVMPATGPSEFLTVAHEYWHAVARSAGLRLPLWLEEGMAEFFSNFRLDERDREGTAKLAARFETLHRHPWMPLSALLALPKDSPLRSDREAASVFYAQSWALTEMLLADSVYSPRFPEFLTAISFGTPSEGALVSVYAKPLKTLDADLRAWVERPRVAPAILPPAEPESAIEIAEASPLASGMVLADVLATAGKLDRAEALYRQLGERAPDDGNVTVSLARIALKRGNDESARRLFERAVEQGIVDDDVFYNLALFENNAGEHESALAHLRAIRQIAPARQFAYWAAVAYAANQLGKRDEANQAADRALACATDEADRAHAVELRMIAQTDVVVQFTRDANGQVHLVSRRVPHGLPDWNPFIEPGDQVRRAEGKLRAIDCDREMAFRVETPAGLLRLTIPDPKHVQVRNAPSEYTCGPQPASEVSVVYAASGPVSGVLRGIEFRPH